MENKNTPAFPDPVRASSKEMIAGEFPGRFPTGLTKREYISAMMLQALVGSDKTKAWSHDEKVTEAIGYADLLLNELQK